MADSRSYTKPHFSHREFPSNHSSVTRHRSYTHIFCKSLLFLIFLIAIPLFPSQAPNFINHSILTNFWELVHLLFIGLAVSYGLFSRRNVEMDFETHSNNYDNEDSQAAFVSRIFHVSPIFEDGYENSCGSGEKFLYPCSNSQFYRGESTVTGTDGTAAINEVSKTRSINFEKETEISLEQDETSVAQAWNSQYFQGESVVVLSQANYAIGEWDKRGQVIGYKSLGLPVRSLKSKIRNPDSAKFSNGSESSSSLIGSSTSPERSMEEEHFGDLGPSNLEEKFNESFPSPSQIRWRSRSERAEMWEKAGPVAARPSHFRPLSVDETQFESLKSQSFRYTTSYSSQASSISSSPTRLSPSESVCYDSPNSETQESGKKEDFRASYPPASQSQRTTVNREARLNAFHLRRYSSGSLFQKDSSGTSKNKVKDTGGRKEDSLGSKEKEDSLGSKEKEDSLGSKDRDDSLGNEESGRGSLKLDKKPATIFKATSRGKSVRTIRSGGYSPEPMKVGEMTKTHIDDKAGKWSHEAKAVNIGNNDKAAKGSDEAKAVNVGKNYKAGIGYDEAKAVNIGEIDKAGKVSDEAKAVNIGKKEKKKEGLDNNVSSGINKKNVEGQYDVPMPTYAKYQKREKEERLGNVTVESGKDSESESDSTPASSDEGSGSESVSDAGHEPTDNEVDKKAGEFIAKFREQIRLQKVASCTRR